MHRHSCQKQGWYKLSVISQTAGSYRFEALALILTIDLNLSPDPHVRGSWRRREGSDVPRYSDSTASGPMQDSIGSSLTFGQESIGSSLTCGEVGDDEGGAGDGEEGGAERAQVQRQHRAHHVRPAVNTGGGKARSIG